MLLPFQPRMLRPQCSNLSSIYGCSSDPVDVIADGQPALGKGDVGREVVFPGQVGMRVCMLVASGPVPLITNEPHRLEVGLDLEFLTEIGLPLMGSLKEKPGQR